MVSIFVCGDIYHPQKGEFVSEELVQIIKTADYAVGNLEGVELPEIQDGINKGLFQAQGTINYLRNIGFDLLLLANNHITDMGKKALQQTLEEISSQQLNYIGAGLSYEDAYRPLVKEINGLRFGFINICEAQVGQYKEESAQYGYAWIGYPSLHTDIRKLSEETDYVVVFAHLGLEHYELPLPEVRQFYRSLCNAGASCVIGAHPHIAQGYEMYDNKLIAYSLGNFYFLRKNGKYPKESTSYSLLLNFSKGTGFSVTPILHSLREDMVYIEKKHTVNLEYLCELLYDNYDELVNKQCLTAYNEVCSQLLQEATCGEFKEKSLLELLKDILRRVFFRKKYITSTRQYRSLLLLRLFENESYRWTIVRALRLKNKMAK